MKILKKFFAKFRSKDVDKTAVAELNNFEEYGWFTTNLTWQEARESTTGYDIKTILDKCLASALLVKQGRALYERDSVVFDKIEYSWPVLSVLMLVAAQNAGELDILDFGGSFATSYYQNRKFLNYLTKVRWSIVEQENFVAKARDNFEDEILKFYLTIADCKKERNPKVILLSSVIQYLEKPYDFLDEIIAEKFEFIIFDLTGFFNEDRDVLTIQKVWPQIYQASYPCWFFSKTDFFAKFHADYELIEEFSCHFGHQLNIDSKPKASYCGAFFKLRNND